MEQFITTMYVYRKAKIHILSIGLANDLCIGLAIDLLIDLCIDLSIDPSIYLPIINRMFAQAKVGFACSFTGSGLVLAGGNLDELSRTKSTFFFNTTTGQWRQLGDMIVDRAQLSLTYMKVCLKPKPRQFSCLRIFILKIATFACLIK